MTKPSVDYSLYYITARSLLPPPPPSFAFAPDADGQLEWHLEHLRLCLEGGVTVVQVREKDVPGRDFYEVAERVKRVCDQYKVPLLINDRLDIALLLRCGLHVGQSDLPFALCRQLLGPDALLGVSVNTVQEMTEVLGAQEGTVDYVGIGPAHHTGTKRDLNPILGVRGVRGILEVLGEREIKAVVIGGITPLTIPNVLAQTPAPLPLTPSSSSSSSSSPSSSSPSSSDDDSPHPSPTPTPRRRYRSLDGLAIISSIASSPTPDVVCRELRKMWDARPDYDYDVGVEEVGGEKAAEKVIMDAARLLDEMRARGDEESGSGKRPLVHHITNTVVQNDTANLTLSLRCSPIMSSSPFEAPSLARLIDCLLLNLGTLSEQQVECQIIAGAEANRRGKRVVFDPVGIGATEYRMRKAGDIMSAVHMSIIKGNAGEIGSLLGTSEVLSRGVDSVGQGFGDERAKAVVSELAAREKLVVAMSGPVDYVSDGQTTFALENGSEWQANITGSGCMASSAVAAFAALEDKSGCLVAAIAGLLTINIAAQHAAARPDVKGPNTFRAALIDECWNVTGADLRREGKVRRI